MLKNASEREFFKHAMYYSNCVKFVALLIVSSWRTGANRVREMLEVIGTGSTARLCKDHGSRDEFIQEKCVDTTQRNICKDDQMRIDMYCKYTK